MGYQSAGIYKAVVGVASAIAVGVMVAGFGAVPSQAASSQIVPIETVAGGFATQTRFMWSESIVKDGTKVDAGGGDWTSDGDGTFTWTAMNPDWLPSADPGHYQYNFGVSKVPTATSEIVPAWLSCTIKDRDTGTIPAQNRVENSGRVTCDYTIPSP